MPAPPARRGRGAPTSASSRKPAAGRVSRSRPSTSTVARSASATAARAFCSTRMTVTPRDRTARSVSKTAATSRGARPAEGSSRIRTRGSTTSARATASIWRWPPDRRPAASVRRRSRSGKSVYCDSMRSRRRGPGRTAAASSRFSRTVSRAKTFSVCGTNARPWRTSRCAGSPVTSCPWRRTDPAVTATSPTMALTRVDLPEPFGPSTATTSPGRAARFALRTIGSPGSYPATRSRASSANDSGVATPSRAPSVTRAPDRGPR